MRLAANATKPVIKRSDAVLNEPPPRVSVVIPSYNHGCYLRDAVESVLTQRFTDWELIIVDDGSTDDTEALCSALLIGAVDTRMTVVHQPASGQPAIARNRGIELARGELVVPLDADDALEPEMLAACVEVYDAHAAVAFVYSDRRDFGASNALVEASDYDFQRLLERNQPHYCALFSRAVWRDVGGYRTNIVGAEDWDFWVAAGAKGHHGKRIARPLFRCRQHDRRLHEVRQREADWYRARVVLNNRALYQDDAVRWAERYLQPQAESRGEAVTGEDLQRPAASVVVCTYNRGERLSRTIAALFEQQVDGESLELVVVNDGSSDDTRARLDALQAGNTPWPVTVIEQENAGSGAARNAGLAVARSPLAVFFDDDQTPEPGYLQVHLDAHREHRNTPISVLGKCVYPPESMTTVLMRHIDESALILAYSRMVDGQLYDWQRYYSGMVSTPVAALREVGGFDADFRAYGCEDADLGLRLQKKLGFRVLYCERAVLIHDHALDYDAVKARQRAVARAHTRLFAKHPDLLVGAWRDVANDTLAGLEAGLAADRDKLACADRQARVLSAVDLADLEALGLETYGAASQRALKLLLMLLTKAWWDEGFSQGLREHQVASFEELKHRRAQGAGSTG